MTTPLPCISCVLICGVLSLGCSSGSKPSANRKNVAPVTSRDRILTAFALSQPAVDMVLCGPADRSQMQEALRALERGPLPPDEIERMQRIGDHIYGRHKPKFKEGGDPEKVDAPWA